jgi:hypothetical protein
MKCDEHFIKERTGHLEKISNMDYKFFLAHLAKGKVSFSTNQKLELFVVAMFDNGSGRNEQSL